MNKKKLFYDLLLVFAISLISLILIFAKYNKNKEDLKAEVWFEGKVVQTIELDSNKELEIELTDDIKIVVEVRKNAIRVVSAPCKNHDCINSSWTSNPKKAIICLDIGYKIILRGVDTPDSVIV